MADAGYSADKKIIEHLIREEKFLKIKETDCAIITDFKKRINKLLEEDKIVCSTWCGKKCERHSAWDSMYQLLIKMNQIRIKKWYFKRIEL